MQLSETASKTLVQIMKDYNVPASVLALVRRVVIEDIKKQIQSHGATVDQILGKALGYPYYCSDQKNFPGTTPEDGVCTGDEVPESLAEEASRHLLRMAAAINRVLSSNQALEPYVYNTLQKGLGTFNGPSIVPKYIGPPIDPVHTLAQLEAEMDGGQS